MSSPALRSLKDRPFELLRELERLAKLALAGRGQDAEQGREWVGVAFRLGSENFLVAREETREVLGLPPMLTRVPGARSWIRGLANVRGQLLPVVDLRAFLGGGATGSGRSTRVLVANNRAVMEDRVNGLGLNVLGWLATLAMFGAAIALVLTAGQS